MKILKLLAATLLVSPIMASEPGAFVDQNRWELIWEDQFDYPDSELDSDWEVQNSPSHHILCSRWRENAVVKDGMLRLENRKEQRGGQEWTSASMWTKKQYKYGYFECRYRYAAATGTNNSFWLMTRDYEPTVGEKFEIDINEGHYPNEVNTNLHRWRSEVVDGVKKNVSMPNSKSFLYGVRPDVKFEFENPIKATKLRLSFNDPSNNNINEFRAYGMSDNGYPDALSESADTDVKGLVNYVCEEGVRVTPYGVTSDDAENSVSCVADGSLATKWSSNGEGTKGFEVEFSELKTLGCIQFCNGWQDKGGSWRGMASDYQVEYYDGEEWHPVGSMDVSESYDFAEEFHTYGLEWTEDELIYYFDGEEIRRIDNEFCYSQAPVFLSLALVKWDGPITDAVDGTFMEVDYVRVYKERE
ncbi:MAG: family 16 glycosylhydrolase [Rikenellaceae bacterium]